MNPAESLFEKIKAEGLPAIQRLIDEDAAETTWLDFKRYGGTGNDKRDWKDARANFSRAISGFGNSDGGLIIWGVKCVSHGDQPDVASDLVPIGELSKFLGRLNDWISEATTPSHRYVQNHAVPMNLDSGLAASYIPLSPERPLQQRFGGRDFVIRAGSRFDEAPYNLLAGMFGLRPAPRIESQLSCWISTSPRPKEGEDVYGITLNLHVVVRNIGPVSAERLFVNIENISEHNNLLPSGSDPEGFWTNETTGAVYVNQTPGRYLAPGQKVSVVTVFIIGRLQGVLVDSDVHLSFSVGAEQTIRDRFELKITRDEMAKISVWAVQNGGSKAISDETLSRLIHFSS